MKINTKAPLLLITLLLFISLPTQVFALTYNIGTPQTVDNNLSVGEYTSLAIVNGYPAISYFDANYNCLRFIRATSTDGSTWGTRITVDTTNNVGEFTSLAIVNGNPAISYYDSTNGDLKFIRANDANGSSWPTSGITVDSSGNVGQSTSLVVANGNPAISYYDVTNGTLKYIRANDANGSSWPITGDTVDNSGDVGYYSSMAIVDGHPAIAYFDTLFPDEALKFIRAEDQNGTIWPLTAQTLDPYLISPLMLGAISMAVVDGNPAISYSHHTSNAGQMDFIRANNSDGSSWSSKRSLSATGLYNSLAVMNGNPAVAYYDVATENLMLIFATTPDGSSWDSPQTLDSDGSVGEYNAMIDLSGAPAISYFDNTNNHLKFITNQSFDISILDGATTINNGDSFNFGTTTLSNPITHTFTIANNGNSELDLTSFSLPAGFSFTNLNSTSLPVMSSQDVEIRLDAFQTGTFSGDLQIGSTDTNQSPFSITLEGTVTENALETGIIAPLDGSTVLDSSIQVAFNHDVLHDGSAEAANNPVNYLLVEDGANNLFDTTTCLLGVAGDDVQQTISSVTYDASTFTATVNTGTLPSGRYQLLVCGTASIEDLTGNVLNGGAFDSATTFTVVSGAGTGSASAASLALLPATGFAPGTQTSLPTQPDSLAYNEMDSLTLQIPSLKVDVPIVGVPQTANGWDVTWLTNAQAGWLNGTAYPTWEGNTVITGHVTNASGNPGPFAEIKTLKFGDQITIQAYGEEYTYEVRENKLVISDDMSIIEEHKSRDWVTLITCEYFNENTGEYLFRRVIRAVLVEVE